MDYYVKHFSELTTKEFLEIATLRTAVFVVEQHCPYQEIDQEDENAWHTWFQQQDKIIGYTRIIAKNQTVTFGRVLIAAAYRQQKLGKKLVAETLKVIAEKYPNRSIIIGAQAHLTAFYAAFGFKVVSDVYLEDGIAHVQMSK